MRAYADYITAGDASTPAATPSAVGRTRSLGRGANHGAAILLHRHRHGRAQRPPASRRARRIGPRDARRRNRGCRMSREAPVHVGVVPTQLPQFGAFRTDLLIVVRIPLEVGAGPGSVVAPRFIEHWDVRVGSCDRPASTTSAPYHRPYQRWVSQGAGRTLPCPAPAWSWSNRPRPVGSTVSPHRKPGVARDMVTLIKMAEPAVREVEMHLLAEPPLRRHAEAITHQQHRDEEFRFDRLPPSMAVENGEEAEDP